MNTLGKTVVAISACIIIIAGLFFSRDFGAPFGYAGNGFGTVQEALEDSIGASYEVKEEIGSIAFDDGVIYLCETKDDKIVLGYAFRNRQQTKYYLESYYIISNMSATEWNTSENKVKTNYKVTLADEIITNCDNLPVDYEEYTVVIDGTDTKIRLYYNRVE